jgi:hypothetical protein
MSDAPQSPRQAPTPVDPGANATVSVICSGTAMDMGRQQGTRLRERIRQAGAILDQLEVFRREKPAWLPYPWFRALAAWRAKRHLGVAMAQACPEQHDRLLGLADGAGVAPSLLYLLAALESGLSSLRRHIRQAPGFACSAVGIGRDRSALDQVLLAHNFDYLPIVAPFYILRESRPARGCRSIEFTLAPLAGVVDGVNEHGLAVTYDYAFPMDSPRLPVPISNAIAGALARCRSVDEAARFISDHARWGGAMLLLADASGDLASLELSNTRTQLRRPEPGAGCIHHTNCFRLAETQSCQIPADAVFGSRAPSALRGQSVLEPHAQRDRRIGELLRGYAKLGLDDLAAVLADHGADGVPGGHTPCVHTDYWQTTACIQILPAQRRMRVSWSSACQADFREVAL